MPMRISGLKLIASGSIALEFNEADCAMSMAALCAISVLIEVASVGRVTKGGMDGE
jgi:hypothetical protein